MKILIINYFFPPVGGAHSYRWQQIAHEWGQQGHEVTILTSKSMDRGKVSKGVNLVEAGNAVPKNRFHKNSGQAMGFKWALVNKLIKPIYRKLYWPDGLWYWLPALLSKLLKMQASKYDLVISYSPTFSAHLGVLFFKLINKSGFKWIADYGDPFSLSPTMPPNNLFLYNHLNRYVEKKILKEANVAVFTNKETLTAYQEVFDDAIYKYIPHAVDIDAFYEKKKVYDSSRKRIRLCYVGGFHKGIREPYRAIEVIKAVINEAAKEDLSIVFDIYGPNNGIDIDKLATGSVFYHGPIDRESAIRQMKSSDILVNIENINCLMSPSKIVEYIATGLPILNCYEQKVSAVFEALHMDVNVLMVGESDRPSSVLSFIKNKFRCQLSVSEVFSILELLTIRSICSTYLDATK